MPDIKYSNPFILNIVSYCKFRFLNFLDIYYVDNDIQTCGSVCTQHRYMIIIDFNLHMYKNIMYIYNLSDTGQYFINKEKKSCYPTYKTITQPYQ